MELASLLSGGAPVLKRYQVDQDFSVAGIPALVSASGESGVDLGTTTGCADFLGFTIDTATKNTAQVTSPATAAELLTVIVNPDAVWRGRWNAGATEGAALTLWTVTTASSDGLSVVVDGDPNSPDLADGIVWGYSGANVGQYRKVTATAANDATVEIPFDNAIAVGDVFLFANRYIADVPGVTLTTALWELSAEVAENASGAEFRVFDVELGDIASNGRNESYALLISSDHAYSGGT